jgi:hypothetical protein
VLVIVADAIDEERGCPVDAALQPGLESLKDTSGVDVVSKLSLKSRHVKLQPRGVTAQAVLGRRAAVFRDSPVHVPKPTLRTRGLYRLGRYQGHRMSVDNREVTHDERQFIADALSDAVKYAEHRLA